MVLSFIFLFGSLFPLTINMQLPSFLPYTQAFNRPLNIAHRGLSSIIPENTIQAFEAALYQGADFVELDVQITKDKQVVVLHDPYLSEVTDITNFPQFINLKNLRQYQQKNRNDVWVDQLTLKELKQFTIKQKLVKDRIESFDYRFGLSSLSEVLDEIKKFNVKHQGKRNPDQRLGGILIEAKDSQNYRDIFHIEIGEKILEVLRQHNLQSYEKSSLTCPIVLQAFDLQTVKYWSNKTDLPIIYLSKHKEKFEGELQEIVKHVCGVGVKDSFFFDEETKKIDKRLLNKIRGLGLLIYSWTYRDDDLVFDSADNIVMYEICQKQLQLDGIITQFPDIYAPLSQLFRKQMHESLPISHQL